MPQTCSVCLRPRAELAAIDRALVEAEPLRKVSERTGLSVTALHRHKAAHLPAKLQNAKQREDVKSEKSLLEYSRLLLTAALQVAAQAKADGKGELFLKAARTAREFLEFEAKLQGQLQKPNANGPPVINVIYSERTLIGAPQGSGMVDVTPSPSDAMALAEPAEKKATKERL